ncbi:hypothetical protein P8452_77738 [Trifolium repens]|nr:hypothetical protein P8452_77738 [Trifolium repens]
MAKTGMSRHAQRWRSLQCRHLLLACMSSAFACGGTPNVATPIGMAEPWISPSAGVFLNVAIVMHVKKKLTLAAKSAYPPNNRPLALKYVSAGTKYQGDPSHNLKAANVFLDRMRPEDFIWTPYDIG